MTPCSSGCCSQAQKPHLRNKHRGAHLDPVAQHPSRGPFPGFPVPCTLSSLSPLVFSSGPGPPSPSLLVDPFSSSFMATPISSDPRKAAGLPAVPLSVWSHSSCPQSGSFFHPRGDLGKPCSTLHTRARTAGHVRTGVPGKPGTMLVIQVLACLPGAMGRLSLGASSGAQGEDEAPPGWWAGWKTGPHGYG